MSSTKLFDDHQHRTMPGPYNCTVMAYPSVGGIVVGQFTGVELEWLGIPRSSPESYSRIPTDEESLKDEDTFALRLLQLGARWWSSLKFKGQHPDASYPYGYHYPPDLHLGYPSASSSGGNKHPVLLLKTFAGDSIRLPEYDPPEKPNDWSRLAACGTMEERCAVLRDFGATEWDDMKKCPDIPQSLREGMAEGKKYEELLRKIEDVEDLDKWMMSL
ncbi:hypothetical protein CDV31_008522 [Fusarium ambrosium]|uniref:Uncharacterized protein n=1 Tax=Fusarium ambrosium TaxID=131363 RepID=A0A428U003_9HYPO|nr:hypothetical protein CDV31_008522 [Fusarium ambrosium]